FLRFRWCGTGTPGPPTPQQHPERAGGGGRAPGGAALGGGGRHIGHVSAHATTVVAACFVITNVLWPVGKEFLCPDCGLRRPGPVTARSSPAPAASCTARCRPAPAADRKCVG